MIGVPSLTFPAMLAPNILPIGRSSYQAIPSGKTGDPEGGRAASEGALWIFFYFAANLCLTLHNKWVLSLLHFNFPWTLTAIHIGVSGIGSYLLLRHHYGIAPSALSTTAIVRLALFSVLYTVNIAISNVSLAFVSLAFHQLVRSATPAFTILMELIMLHKGQPGRIYLSLIPVVLGIGLATIDEAADIAFSPTGLLLTIFGVILSSLKGIVTNVLMVGPLKLHPLEVIWRMSLPSVIQCLIYGGLFGELQRLGSFFFPERHLPTTGEADAVLFAYSATFKLLLNGLLAMWLNWVSFTANKKTSALSMTVAGNVKQALSIVLAIYIFNTRITRLNLLGIIATLIGGAWYSHESYRHQQRLRHGLSG